VIQWIVVGVGVGMSRYVYTVDEKVFDSHERMTHASRQIDGIAGRLNNLSRAVPLSPEDKQQLDLVSEELDEVSATCFLDTAPELPAETAKVGDAAAKFNRLWRASLRAGGDPAQLRDDAALSLAVADLERALDVLRSGVAGLDEANYTRREALQQIRLWAIMVQALAWLLTLFAFGYAFQLYRHMRGEELARFGVESELAAERTALEERVQKRTAALEAEVEERQRAERLNRSRNHMLEMVARNEPIADTFRVVADMVAEIRRNAVCTIHSLDSGKLTLLASSGSNDRLRHNLDLISRDFSEAPESVARLSRNPNVIEDLAAERKPWSELLCANGLVSVWSAPFFASDANVLGILTVYTRLKWQASAEDSETLEMARHMSSLVLERSGLQAKLMEHAYHDSLTGSPNRRSGQDRLAKAIARGARLGGRFCVLWIDLNRFKEINDQYGHTVGDAVLQQASQRLSARLRASDTLARMGGDEFMAILEGTSSREDAERLACEMLEILASPMHVGELELVVSGSIGVSLYPEDGKTVSNLAQHADQAMYAAKFASGGCRSFSPELDREPAERRELEAELSEALKTDSFTVAYQG
jgi:diguanylate cyclase (GGDEF)-like protein